jgi:predicted alpha/beta superfamily hydrolase
MGIFSIRAHTVIEKHTLSVWSPELKNRRAVDVYLPPSYAAGRQRFPVVYLQDGQNLSDPSIAFGGNTWQLEGALERLARGGIEIIAVGIHNRGDARLAEYSPFLDARHGGGAGDRYLRFVVDTIKPRIDRRYRTDRRREATAIAGSSMGALIALYGFFEAPRTFGRVAALSPSIWFGARRLLEFVEAAGRPDGRIYVDAGTSEGAQTLRDTRRLVRLLRRKGYDSRTALRYLEATRHRHTEIDWAKRLPGALEFLLRP